MTAIIAGVSKDHGNDDARQVVHDFDELIEPPPTCSQKKKTHPSFTCSRESSEACG